MFFKNIEQKLESLVRQHRIMQMGSFVLVILMEKFKCFHQINQVQLSKFKHINLQLPQFL